MTSPVSAVEAKPRRFSNDRNPNGLGYSNGVVEDEQGYYVLHSDYEALARQAEALKRENAELREALTPFASIAEHDIGHGETDAELFQPMNKHNRAPRLTVGDFRRARTLLKEEANAE